MYCAYIIARLILVIPITKLQCITEHANEMASKDLLEAIKAMDGKVALRGSELLRLA